MIFNLILLYNWKKYRSGNNCEKLKSIISQMTERGARHDVTHIAHVDMI